TREAPVPDTRWQDHRRAMINGPPAPDGVLAHRQRTTRLASDFTLADAVPPPRPSTAPRTRPHPPRPGTVLASHVLLSLLLTSSLASMEARADDAASIRPVQEANLVKQANAPISSILQVRIQDTYVPDFTGADGQGNTLTMAV